MRGLPTAMAIVGAVAAASGIAHARDAVDRLPLPARAIPLAEQAIYPPQAAMPDWRGRHDELEKWVEDFSSWKKWIDRWGNRREPGWFSGFRKRRPRPDPPDWLSDRCADSLDEGGATAEACTLLAEWRSAYPTAKATIARATASTAAEDDNKTIWWEHVHLDVAWPAMQSRDAHFGVIGMHATTSVRGRLEIFIAPGVMLLNVATGTGTHAWKLAANYGIAYRLGNIRFPGSRQALLHLNLAKAWLLSAGPDVPMKSTDFVGFSVTFKK